MGKNTCWSCGTTYDGWSCPVCEARKALEKHAKEMARISERESREREEEAEAMREAIEDAAAGIESTLDDAVRRQEDNIANAHRLKSQAMADDAYDQYRARRYEQALQLCINSTRGTWNLI